MYKFKLALITVITLSAGCNPDVNPNIGGIEASRDFSERLTYFGSVPTVELCRMAIDVENATGSTPFSVNLGSGSVVWRASELIFNDNKLDATSNAYVAMNELDERMDEFATAKQLSCSKERGRDAMENYNLRLEEYQSIKANCEATTVGIHYHNCMQGASEPLLWPSEFQCGLKPVPAEELCKGAYNGKNFISAMLDANAEYEREKANAIDWSSAGNGSIISCTSNTFFNTTYTNCR